MDSPEEYGITFSLPFSMKGVKIKQGNIFLNMAYSSRQSTKNSPGEK